MKLDPRSVMVVEDHDDTRELIHMMLGFEQFHVHGFGDHKSAINWLKLQKYAPCAIVLNCKVSDLAAEDFIREFGHLGMRSHIVLVSGSHRPAERAKELGIIHYLQKPFPPDALLNIINHLSHVCAQAS